MKNVTEPQEETLDVIGELFRIASVEAPQRAFYICVEIADDFAARFKHLAGSRDELLQVLFEDAPSLGRKRFNTRAYEHYLELTGGAEDRIAITVDWQGFCDDLTAIAYEYAGWGSHGASPVEDGY